MLKRTQPPAAWPDRGDGQRGIARRTRGPHFDINRNRYLWRRFQLAEDVLKARRRRKAARS